MVDMLETERGTPRDGRSTRWDRHRHHRRITIIEAAITAIEEYGPHALTAQIAAQAGVPRTHVYRHFDGKQALDLAVAGHAVAELTDALGADVRTGSLQPALSAAIGAHLRWVGEHPNLYRFLAQHAYAVAAAGGPAVDDARSALAGALAKMIRRHRAGAGAGAEVSATVQAVGLAGMVDSTAAWWLAHPDVPRAALAEQLTGQAERILASSAEASHAAEPIAQSV